MSDDLDAGEIGVICGPTAAGKSAIALWIAAQAPATIIAADSRQVYRLFDIGTAKPSADEQMRVPHRGLDVADPMEQYSAAAWVSAANTWIDESLRAGRTPLVVGGTGLYVRALFDGLFEQPLLDEDRRAHLRVALSTFDTLELGRWAGRLDPRRAHLGRAQLLRAVEMALLTGQRLSDLHRSSTRVPRWTPRYLVVDPGTVLASRIESRTDFMLENGWPDEVERLMHSVPANAPAWNATGYNTLRGMIAGTITRPAARDAIVIGTRQYAKRQRTWFRNQLPPDRVTRIDPLAADWMAVLSRWLRTVGTGR